MLSLKTKAQLDVFLSLIEFNQMISLQEISKVLNITKANVEKLFDILETKDLVKIVAKPDYIELTKTGKNFKLESKFIDANKVSTITDTFNVYLGSSLPNTDRIIVGISTKEVEKIADAFGKGIDHIFVVGVRYELSTLRLIKIFKSERPEEYNDYLTFKANEGEVIHNRFNEVLFHVQDLLHFGDEVTRQYIDTNFGQKKMEEKPLPKDYNLDIFISHSHKDKEIAKLIADLIAKAFNLTNDKIRCTSAAGYKFKGGTKTMETLRSEVEKSNLLIALISENSVKSHYVLFELGARWGLEMSYIPLFYNEEGASLLPGPLSNIIGLSMSDNSDMHQFITDISDEINVPPQLPKVYNQLINEVVDFAKTKF